MTPDFNPYITLNSDSTSTLTFQDMFINASDSNTKSGKFSWLDVPPAMKKWESETPLLDKPAYIRYYPIGKTGMSIYTYRLSEDELQHRLNDGYLFLAMDGEWHSCKKYESLVTKLNLRVTKGLPMPWFTIRGQGFRLEDPKNFPDPEG